MTSPGIPQVGYTVYYVFGKSLLVGTVKEVGPSFAYMNPESVRFLYGKKIPPGLLTLPHSKYDFLFTLKEGKDRLKKRLRRSLDEDAESMSETKSILAAMENS